MNEISSVEVVDDWFIDQSKKLNELDRIANEHGVYFLQYDILFHLTRLDCNSPTELSDKIQLSRSSVSRTLRVLQSKELVKRKHDDNGDQRRVVLENTTKAHKIVDEISKKILDLYFAL